MTTYVLVHGAWHRGEMMEDVAEAVRAHGHDVFCPTLAGNRIDDAKDVGVALPAALPWHPRLSDRLGLDRYGGIPGRHEVNSTDPKGLGEKIIVAGRD